MVVEEDSEFESGAVEVEDKDDESESLGLKRRRVMVEESSSMLLGKP